MHTPSMEANLQKASSEELILSAAQEVFMEKGLAGARMQEIADRAGMNKALLHYYFRSKEKLFQVVITKAISSLLPRLLGVIETDLDLFDKIRHLTSEFIGFLNKNSFLPVFIVNEINRNPQFFFKNVVRQEKAHLDSFQRQVEEAVHQGRIRPISPDQLFMNMMSMVVFPFLAKPVFKEALGIPEEEYQRVIDRRRIEVADFLIQSLRP